MLRLRRIRASSHIAFVDEVAQLAFVRQMAKYFRDQTPDIVLNESDLESIANYALFKAHGKFPSDDEGFQHHARLIIWRYMSKFSKQERRRYRDISLCAPHSHRERCLRYEIDYDVLAVQCLQQAVSLLPPSERAVIRALFTEGLSQREVADRLSVSAPWVSLRKQRAFARLRQLMLKSQPRPHCTDTLLAGAGQSQ